MVNKYLLLNRFHQNQSIIVLGATNRREDLDRALLRPGRFDIEVDVRKGTNVQDKKHLKFTIKCLKMFKKAKMAGAMALYNLVC